MLPVGSHEKPGKQPPPICAAAFICAVTERRKHDCMRISNDAPPRDGVNKHLRPHPYALNAETRLLRGCNVSARYAFAP